MKKSGRWGMFLGLGALIVILGGLGWFLTIVFEGEAPRITLDAASEYLSGKQKLKIVASDGIRGLKTVTVTVKQGGRELTVLDESFPFVGMLNREGTHLFEKEIFIDPAALNLAQGPAGMTVQVWDYSRRSSAEGNLSLVQHDVVVDTLPPAIRPLSRMHNVRLGGTGLAVYETAPDAAESGLYVGDLFFKGFPAGKEFPEGVQVCYFALPISINSRSNLFLWARDKAGNETKAKFYYHLKSKRFRTDDIKISSGFLSRVLPYFASYDFQNSDGSEVERFLEINRNLRMKNAATFYALRTKTSPEKMWEGTWLRQNNSANMARFGDRRKYYYKGKIIDEQVHMGVDLASLANSEVHAANQGRVLFADNLGIYGLTVVLDHGQGLASSYSHLSKISVTPGQEVKRGEVIGFTGQTGLAGGDHLHFGIFVQGVPVDPVEWWDPHWIEDNVTGKLSALKKSGHISSSR